MYDQYVKCPQCGEGLKDYKPKVFAEIRLGSKKKKVYRCTNSEKHRDNEHIVWSVEEHAVPNSFTAINLYVVHDKRKKDND